MRWRKLGQLKEEIENYNLAIKYKPNYINTYKGMRLHKLGQLHEEIESYNLAIKYKPDYADSYFKKGIVYTN
ncbi:tetratricopeptide repeat protein [Orientia tsutsugamushi]|uniref:Tetratricopeptide repeat family protein n=1 Tax=Orientia tsutsugamushi str. TA716 TaxID=1359175 RepID=A0A0F3NT09_ORITS|nr:tetratricopeptide repeat protein [Orientia tsutsugamushi]KJV70901.1 tetratricopeptide repeat family protein [Orientia tsutsugamushi str. TA716]